MDVSGLQSYGFQKGQQPRWCLPNRQFIIVLASIWYYGREAKRWIYKKIVPFAVIASATIGSRSPEFPIQVVHPYPTKLKPRSLKYLSKPLNHYNCTMIIISRGYNTQFHAATAIRDIGCIRWLIQKYLLRRYLVTTPDPGARLVLIHGFTLSKKNRQLKYPGSST
jgi:hypothetical protein